MGRTQKLYASLDALEAEFERRLVAELRQVAEGAGGLFFIDERHPEYQVLSRYARPEMAALEKLGAEIEFLRRKLKEPAAGSLVARFRKYRRQWGDLSDHHRGTDRTLAKQLLAEMGPKEP